MTSEYIISGHNKPFEHIKDFLSCASHEIIIIAPYIKTSSLKRLLPSKELNITVITSWKPRDFLMGVSDLNLYDFAKRKSINLFINNRIHLKVYIQDWEKCITGSANVTMNGLGLSTNYNYELNSEHDTINSGTKIYLKSILNDSILIDDTIYNQYEDLVQNLPPVPKIEEIKLDEFKPPSRDFLISSLPMSKNIGIFYKIYSNDFIDDDQVSVDCAVHDVVIYKLPLYLSQEDFINHLRRIFFESQFIIKLLEFISEEERYFGRVKEWIQKNCADVPVPSRRDLTGNIQVLYKWIVDLSEGKYKVDRPNYSERIRRVK